MKHVLFICSQNRLRSPTAERIFSTHPSIECSSAGLDHDAEIPVAPELIEWADLIFVMENAHLNRLHSNFKSCIGNKRVVCLDIPDKYEYMDPELVELLISKVAFLLTD